MKPNDEIEAAKLKVLAVWPDVIVRQECHHERYPWRAYRNEDGRERCVGLGDSEEDCWYDITTADCFAEDAAAFRLPAPAPVSQAEEEDEDGWKAEAIAKRKKFLSLSDEEKARHCVFCGEEFVPPVCGHINCGGRLLDVRVEASPAVAKVEGGDGLPPLDFEIQPWTTAVLSKTIYCRERQLRESLQREERLKKQLIWTRDHVAELANNWPETGFTPQIEKLEGLPIEQPTIAFRYKRAALMPDGSVGCISIGEFAGDRSKDLHLTKAQAMTLADQINAAVTGE